ncbi:MAG: hypothetical protein LBJ48_05775, partial [Coriobacteriales bacterium]|nr:hypothetical protein [Coriobacteriales bacterium]
MRRRLLSVLLALALVAVVPAAPGFAGESEQPSFDENAVVAAPTQSALADESVESKPALVQEDTLQGEPEPGVTDETEPALSTEPQEAETDSTGDRKTPDTQEGEG